MRRADFVHALILQWAKDIPQDIPAAGKVADAVHKEEPFDTENGTQDFIGTQDFMLAPPGQYTPRLTRLLEAVDAVLAAPTKRENNALFVAHEDLRAAREAFK